MDSPPIHMIEELIELGAPRPSSRTLVCLARFDHSLLLGAYRWAGYYWSP